MYKQNQIFVINVCAHPFDSLAILLGDKISLKFVVAFVVFLNDDAKSSAGQSLYLFKFQFDPMSSMHSTWQSSTLPSQECKIHRFTRKHVSYLVRKINCPGDHGRVDLRWFP